MERPQRNVIQEPYQLGDNRLNRLNTCSTYHQDHDSNWEHGKVLLKFDVSVGGDEDVKLGASALIRIDPPFAQKTDPGGKT